MKKKTEFIEIESDDEEAPPAFDAALSARFAVSREMEKWKKVYKVLDEWRAQQALEAPRSITGFDVGSATPSGMRFDLATGKFVAGCMEDIRPKGATTNQSKLAINTGEYIGRNEAVFGADMCVCEQQVGMGAGNQVVEMAMFGRLGGRVVRSGNTLVKETWPEFFPETGNSANHRQIIAMAKAVLTDAERRIIGQILMPIRLQIAQMRDAHNAVKRHNAAVKKRNEEAARNGTMKKNKNGVPIPEKRKRPVTLPDDSESHLSEGAMIAAMLASAVLGFDLVRYRIAQRNARLGISPTASAPKRRRVDAPRPARSGRPFGGRRFGKNK